MMQDVDVDVDVDVDITIRICVYVDMGYEENGGIIQEFDWATG
jgi:hypothetical protein